VSRPWRLLIELTQAIIGELGVPFDMKKTGLLGLARGSDDGGDYEQSTKVGSLSCACLLSLIAGDGRAAARVW
jgi:hypothetical protein